MTHRAAAAALRRFFRRCSSRAGTAAVSRMDAEVSALDVIVGHTERSGRGVYAGRDFAMGEVVIHRAEPLVAHPTLRNLRTSCYHCLKPLAAVPRESRVPTHGGRAGGGAAGHFCCDACADAAHATYHDAETAAGDAVAPLVAHCTQHGLKFPLAAARMAYAIAQGNADPRDADALVRVNFPRGVAPGAWLDEHAMIKLALARGDAVRGGAFGGRASEVTAEWYVGVVSRMHLNAFRVEIPPPAVGNRDDDTADDGHHDCDGPGGSCDHHSHHSPAASSFKASLEAALASSETGDAAGTATYLAPSLFNHSCDPNVDVAWVGGDAGMRMRTRVDVARGAELTICYTDGGAPVDARRGALEHAYGFVCRCERCVEEGG